MDSWASGTGLDKDRLERISEHLMQRYIEPGKIAGAQVQVVRHGDVAYHRSFGLRDKERGTPWTDDTIVRLYSMTKPITSVALMMLYERGLFQLGDPVHRVIPEWRDHQVWVSGDGDDMLTEAPRRPVSFRDMLCHTGGITYGTMLESLGAPATNHPVDNAYKRHDVSRQRDSTLAEFVARLGRVPLRYQPGEQWMYSLSTDVCGHLVEALSGKTLDRFFAEEIFEPLGMNDTGFCVPEEKADRFAACYTRDANKQLKLLDDPANSQYLQAPTFLSGGGGLVGTLADYHRFTEMLRRGGELDGVRLLGPRTLELMAANHLKDGADLQQIALGSFSETGYEGTGFGLGFAMSLDQSLTQGLGIGDYYWGGAASTIFWVDPVEDLTLIFLTQMIPSATFNFRGQLRNIVYSSIID